MGLTSILSRHKSSEVFDAIVIGSGAGGATLALRLGERGLRVLLVEKGDYLRPASRRGATSLYLTDILDRNAPIECVGGKTKFYGAALYRYRPRDFEAVAYERGVSPAWPIRYDDLEPYYGEAERLYRVHGAQGGDRDEPPRSSPYPFPAIDHAPLVRRVVERLERGGVPVAMIPRGLDRRPGGGPCVLCAGCDAHHCLLDAKMDAEIAAVRPALATGNVVLATRSECRNVLTDGSGRRAIGVLLGRNGEETTVRAGVVAVCAGIPGTPLLLRRSRTDRHPDGLGNHAGALGRYMAGHSTGMIFPFVSWKALPPTHTKTFAISAFRSGAADWPHPLGLIQAAGQMPFWNEAAPAIRPIARFVGRRSLTCFFMTEALPTAQSGFVFNGDDIVATRPPEHNLASFARLREEAVRLFRRAGYPALARRRPPYLWHEVGAARMGSDPATSVVDADLNVHGVAGLYIVDASVLPSAGAVNTALTIYALALKAGDHIAGRSGEHQRCALSAAPTSAAQAIAEAAP